jgi:hypothetical protein
MFGAAVGQRASGARNAIAPAAMTGTDSAALGSAIFAAVAAGASWASVWQNRRERIGLGRRLVDAASQQPGGGAIETPP